MFFSTTVFRVIMHYKNIIFYYSKIFIFSDFVIVYNLYDHSTILLNYFNIILSNIILQPFNEFQFFIYICILSIYRNLLKRLTGNLIAVILSSASINMIIQCIMSGYVSIKMNKNVNSSWLLISKHVCSITHFRLHSLRWLTLNTVLHFHGKHLLRLILNYYKGFNL